MDEETNEGLGRRDLLKRGAVLGGAVIWTTPVVQSLATPAFAQATVAGEQVICTVRTTFFYQGPDGGILEGCGTAVATTQACCDTLALGTGTGIEGLLEALAATACQGVSQQVACP
jgi:hypothetical protein